MKWIKINESSENTDTIEIDTGLKGNKAYEILSSVIGQMSDGIWENSPSMDKYWSFSSVVKKNGERVFLVIDRAYRNDYSKVNGFLGMDEKMIKVFFAKKVKQIAKFELEDDDIGEWKRDNVNTSSYLQYDQDITIQDAYFVYEHLLGRSGFQKKYPQEVCDEFI